MRLDKKVSGGEIKFVLARRIGAGRVRPQGARRRCSSEALNSQPSTLNH